MMSESDTARADRGSGSVGGRVGGCVALVTGAAKGIGAAIAGRLAEEGASVWLVDIDEAAGRDSADALRQRGLAARFERLDITDEAAWAALAARIDQQHGGLDILVNNAGIAPVKALAEMEAAFLRRTLQVNAESALIGLQAMLPLLRARSAARRGGASVVNMASLLGQRALPGHLAYGMSKAALLQFSRGAAIELAQGGDAIRVNSVLPAITESPMVEREIEEWAEAGTFGTHEVAATRRALESRIPLKRLGQPRDIADAVLFLASTDSAFMTGTELVVDGGRAAL